MGYITAVSTYLYLETLSTGRRRNTICRELHTSRLYYYFLSSLPIYIFSCPDFTPILKRPGVREWGTPPNPPTHSGPLIVFARRVSAALATLGDFHRTVLTHAVLIFLLGAFPAVILSAFGAILKRSASCLETHENHGRRESNP